MTTIPAQRTGKAVVIGGSMAGLLTARVLSEHFSKVTLIERDGLAMSPDPRKGVPQGRHVHVLLHSGIQVIEHLFPDLLSSLAESGLIVRSDVSRDFRWRHFGVWKARFNSGIDIVFIYRPSFEFHVASRVAALENVDVVSDAEACGLTALLDRGRITGVKIRRADGEPEEALPADLVVDASGRGSQTPKWLREIGLSGVTEDRVEVNVGYASRVYARAKNPSESLPLFVLPRAPQTRGGAVFPIEGNRWMVTLAGWVSDYPPSDENDFLEFARSLDVPDIYQCLKSSVPQSPVSVHKFPANVWRRYDKQSDLPDSLLVIGDAMCSFNPVYAQGMTVAALEAIALGRLLRERWTSPSTSNGVSQAFFRLATRLISNPWLLATGEDLRYPDVDGHRSAKSWLFHRYGGAIHTATSTDERVARQFYRVMSLAAPVSSLFAPGIVLRAAPRMSLR